MTMQLTRARVSLTNYYVPQVFRNNQVDLSNQLVDELITMNSNGGINTGAIFQAAALSGCLNQQAQAATIMGGWNATHGLMQLDFVIESNPLRVKMMHVLGYLNNLSGEGLSTDTVFVPQHSWISQQDQVSSLDMLNPVSIRHSQGRPTDYLLNDGSNQAALVSLRPTDIIEYGVNAGTHQDMMNRMAEEGLEGMMPMSRTVASDISRVGVIASKRSNMSPTGWAADILNAGVNFQQRSRQFTGSGMGDGESQGLNDGMYGELCTQLHQAANREGDITLDYFFADMMATLGSYGLRGTTGYAIGDIMMTYPNFEEIHDITLCDANMYPQMDFTEIAMGMGTSSLPEIVVHSIMFNISDLLARHGISSIQLIGSNCDNGVGEHANSNIVIMPMNVFTQEDNDMNRAQKGINLAQDLTNQIFQRLNGYGGYPATPLRFNLTAELFGSTVINLTLVDEHNLNDSFDYGDGKIVGSKQWSFPTFAINNASSVIGTNDVAVMAGSNFFQNIESYFSPMGTFR